MVSVSWVPEYLPPSANVGLPSHLIQCHRPWPAYTTHTAPVVKMLVEQDERRKAASNRPAETETNGEPQEAEEVTQVPKLSRGSSTHGTGKDSVGMSTAESSLPSPSVCNRVIFARKPPLRVLPILSLMRYWKARTQAPQLLVRASSDPRC
uniref:Uncharacterized protein n=1 Tax=Falco tinnunculus TaxID=100819 RepID=A0A8C4XQ46_FALTI